MMFVINTDTSSGMSTAGRPFRDVPAGGVGVRRRQPIPREWARRELLYGVDFVSYEREFFLKALDRLEAVFGDSPRPTDTERIAAAREAAEFGVGKLGLDRSVGELARLLGLPKRTLEYRATLLRQALEAE